MPLPVLLIGQTGTRFLASAQELTRWTSFVRICVIRVIHDSDKKCGNLNLNKGFFRKIEIFEVTEQHEELPIYRDTVLWEGWGESKIDEVN